MRKSIIKAVFTLSLFTIVERTFGFAFKIYLSRELGSVAMGVYQVALSIFYVILSFVTSGIPLVVSKLTAKYRAEKNEKAERGLAAAALIVGVVIASTMCLVCFLFRDIFGGILATRQSMTLLIIMLPGTIFSAIYASLRGNLWGHEKYTLVSVVEVIEQIVRILVCVILFNVGFNKLKSTALAMSIGCALSCLSCVIGYFALKGKLGNPKGQFKPLLKSAVPITAVRASGTLLDSLIAIFVPFLLVRSGMSTAESMAAFGVSMGMALPLLYIPMTAVGSLAFVMIPTLSSAVSCNDKQSIKRQVENAISFSITLSALFVPLFFELGGPIGELIYGSAQAGEFLAYSAWLLIPISIESITSSMMNSLDLEMRSFFNYLIGSAALFLTMIIFMNNFSLKILSIAMGVNWLISSALHILAIKKKTGVSLKFMFSLLRALCLIFPAIILNRCLYSLFGMMPAFFRIGFTAVLSMVFMVGLNIVFSAIDLTMFKQKKSLKGKAAQNKSGAQR